MQADAHKSELMTVAELAQEWRQHPASIYRKIQDGTIPSVCLGDGTSALRIPRAAHPTAPGVVRPRSSASITSFLAIKVELTISQT
jgi:hypothetical protein